MIRPRLPIWNGSALDNYRQKGRLDWANDHAFSKWGSYDTLAEDFPCYICKEIIKIGAKVAYHVCRMQAAHYETCCVHYEELPVWVD